MLGWGSGWRRGQQDLGGRCLLTSRGYGNGVQGKDWSWARFWEIMHKADFEAVREGSEPGLRTA